MANFEYPGGFVNMQGTPNDPYYSNQGQPYADVAAVLAAVPAGFRLGRQVLVADGNGGAQLLHFVGGTDAAHLVAVGGNTSDALSRTATTKQEVAGPVRFLQNVEVSGGYLVLVFSDGTKTYLGSTGAGLFDIFQNSIGNYASKGQAGDWQLMNTDALPALDSLRKLSKYVEAMQLGAAQWVAGKQVAGTLVYNDSVVWRVKADLANSQSGPTQAAPNAQYYEFVGGPSVLTALQQLAQTLRLDKLDPQTVQGQVILNKGLKTLYSLFFQQQTYGLSHPTTLATETPELYVSEYLGLWFAGRPLMKWRGAYSAGVYEKGELLLYNQEAYIVTTAYVDATGQNFDASKHFKLATSAGQGGPTYSAGAGIDLTGGVISTQVAKVSTTALAFVQDAEYAPIYSGTFTVDPTNPKLGAVVTAYLGPAATQPTLPSTGFQLLAGAFVPGSTNMYTFKVGANGSIQYLINQVA